MQTTMPKVEPQFWGALEYTFVELYPYLKELLQEQRSTFKYSPLQVSLLEKAQAWKSHLKNCRKRKEKNMKFWDCLEPSGLEGCPKPDGGSHDGGPTAGKEKGEGHEGTPIVVLKGGPVSWRTLCGGGPSGAGGKADVPADASLESAGKAEEPADASLESAGRELAAVMAAEGPQMKQPKLARFFKKPWEVKPEDMQMVTVQKATSKHVPIAQLVESAALAESLLVYEEHRLVRKRSFGDDGGGAGILGGRPVVQQLVARGVSNAVDKSNRLPLGVPRRRHDITPWEGRAIVKDMLKLQQMSSLEAEWRSRCVQRFRPRPWRSLMKVFSRGLEYWERQVRLAGVGAGSRGSLNMQGQSLKGTHRASRAMGCRAQGAGRRDRFGIFKRALEDWVSLERENGHTLDSRDLLEQFKWMVREAIRTLKERDRASTLTPAGRSRLLEYEARLQRIAGTWNYRKWYMTELMKACRCRYLKPQRQTKLSYEEEEVRCRLTWQQWDRRMWDIAFGGPEVLKRLVVDPDHLQSRLEDCVLGFSDQVPWWGLVGSKKQVYCEWELCKKKLADAGETLQQLRGHDNDTAMKFRITVELRQVILNYFSTTQDPIGVLGPTLLVVGGATHCRLSNISADGKWLESESFVVHGKEVRHCQGRPVGNRMKSWRDLRLQCPELFEGITVMQQPAAVVDSILMAWILEEQGKLYPCSLWQRDLSGGGGYSTASRQRMQVIGQVPAWIAAKMTSVMQLTDTDFAYRLKAFAAHEKDLLKLEMKAAAAKAEVEATFRCGAYEILRIVKNSLQRLEQVTVRENLVLAAARRNGMLAWRPDLTAGKLVCPDAQPWCRDLPPSCRSHRLKAAWSRDRMNWLDAGGRPLEPDWTQCDVAKDMQDHLDLAALPAPSEVTIKDGEWAGPRCTVGGKLYEEVQLDLGDYEEFKAEEGLKEGMRLAAFLQASPRDRLLDMETSALLAPQGEAKKEDSKVAKKGLKAKLHNVFLQKWRAKARKQLKDDGVSKMELLGTLVPQCGPSLAGDPAKMAVKKWMKTIAKVAFFLCFLFCVCFFGGGIACYYSLPETMLLFTTQGSRWGLGRSNRFWARC